MNETAKNFLRFSSAWMFACAAFIIAVIASPIVGLRSETASNVFTHLFMIAAWAYIGIGHGFFDVDRVASFRNLLVYLALIPISFLILSLAPALSLAIFIMISLMHFSVTHTSAIHGLAPHQRWVQSLLWSVGLLSAAVRSYITEFKRLPLLALLDDHLSSLSHVLTAFIPACALILFAYSLLTRDQSKTRANLTDIATYLLFAAGFFLLPWFLAFSVFFLTMHALPSFKSSLRRTNSSNLIIWALGSSATAVFLIAIFPIESAASADHLDLDLLVKSAISFLIPHIVFDGQIAATCHNPNFSA